MAKPLHQLPPLNSKEQAAVIGRIVHYVLDQGPAAGQHRPALIVNVVGDEANLQIFTDSPARGQDGDYLPQLYREAGVPYPEKPVAGTWHWPEKS